MDVIVEFNEAAFRHGISREDILNAIKTNINIINVFHAMKARKSIITSLGL